LIVGLIVVALASLGSALVASSLRGQDEVGGAPPVLGKVGDFDLIAQDGERLRRSDLRGTVWIADFIFTRCAGPCPIMTSRMRLMQDDLDPEVRLVSFTVDPDYDTPEVLTRYARNYGADLEQWSFVTGDRDQIVRFSVDSLKLLVGDQDAANQIPHSKEYVLVDRRGRIRGYYTATDDEKLAQLRIDVKVALGESAGLIPLYMLPTVNASLNGLAALLILTGFALIRAKRVTGHRVAMVSAFVTSSLFLVSYVYYHIHEGGTPFPGSGWIRPVYFTILISHVILAIALVPMVLVTLYHATRGQFDRHRRIARWTFPIWLYISVTGVIIYWLLYVVYDAA
ncbi:MAG: DUF420 domain-containing protein, partial [Planctomycetota bacterium]|nr:DUF420 domain-containing protein [Planctomycetota bacterium]